jgi:hypothetical protein
MSFDYNPYKHLEIIVTRRNKKKRIVEATFFCHGCGHQDNVSSPDVAIIYERFAKHLTESHHRTEEDFEDWSTY